jgi:hypothetical protein
MHSMGGRCGVLGEFCSPLLLVFAVAAALPTAAGAAGDERWVVIVEGLVDSHEQLGLSDARPVSRGEVGGRIGLEIPVGGSSDIRVSGGIGGNRYSFNGSSLGGLEKTMSLAAAGAFLWQVDVAEGLHLRFGPELVFRHAENRISTSDLLGPDQVWTRVTTAVGVGPSVAVRKALDDRLGLEFGLRGLVERSQMEDESTGAEYSWWGPSLGVSTALTFGL